MVNATVTLIVGGGAAEDYDSLAGADTQRWAGSQGGYVREEILSEVTSGGQGGTLTEVRVTRLAVDLALADLVQRGDSVTYTYAGETATRTVRSLARYRMVGTATLTFWDE